MGKKKVAEQAGTPVEKGVIAPKSSGKKSHKLLEGKVYINASYNNTVVSVTDRGGNLVAWASAGSLGFSGPKKATPFASSKVIAAISEKVKPMGLTTIDIVVKGVGGGRDSAIRSLINQGFMVSSVKDVTPIPHNGPRPRKIRRV